MSRSHILSWLLGIAGLAGVLSGPGQAAESEPAPIRIGVLTDNYPYSFRDTDGEMRGFTYELVQEIERAMGLRLERVHGTTAEIGEAFRNGQLDAVQTMAQFPEREGMADFSVPYLTMEGSIFVHASETKIRGIADLRGRRVLVHAGSLGETVLRRAGLDGSVVLVDSVRQALTMLDRQEGDATLATRLSGLAVAHHHGLRHVRALDVAVEGYGVRYCIAVRKGEARTLAQINEGLAVLVRTGRFDAVYRKWFGHLEPERFSKEHLIGAVVVGLALALVVALWAAVKQGKLRRQIAQQAEALRLSEERYRGIFEGARDGLLLVARDELGPAVRQVNPAALRLLARESLPPGSAGLSDLLAPDVLLTQAMAAAMQHGRAEEFEHERPGGAGWWRVGVSPLGTTVLVSLTDITEAVRARRRLQQQEEQLRQKQKLEAVGTLAGGVAHDFNNLLTAIMGNTELCLMGLPPDHPEAPGLRLVLKAAKRARDLVQQILAFSRQSAPRREVVNLVPLVEETINLLRTMGRGTVQFEARLPADLPAVLADPAQVHQVLMNLGTNAVQAMRGAAGRLGFSAEVVETGPEQQSQHPELKPGRYVRIAVQDTGPGMTAEVQRRVFEPFFTTKPAGEGTGLGLAVVHGIMQQHGGAVTLYSQAGRGTLFHLYFPLATSTVAVLGEGRPAGLSRGQGELVLFVDDEDTIVQTACKILAHLGYKVRAHARPEDAWADYRDHAGEFALVVSDLTMPGLTGLQLLAQIRKLRADQPFVLSSGFFSEAERTEALARGVSVLLPKPLSYASLGEAVAVALRRN